MFIHNTHGHALLRAYIDYVQQFYDAWLYNVFHSMAGLFQICRA
jgi:hypothetical protein